MKAKLQNRGLRAALAAVLGSLLMAAGIGAAASLTPPAHAASSASQSNGWTHLGGEPLFPGGLAGIARQHHISMRQAFVYAVTSSRGQTALAYAGLRASERSAVNHAARTGKFYSCQLRYGMTFDQMSFGINGTAVDKNVTFLDPRYRYHPAGAFCMNVRSGGTVLHLLVPYICVNIALKNRTPVAHHHKIRKPKKTKPGTVRIVIVKQAFSSAINEEQLIRPTPTNVFRFAVRCGLKGKIRFYMYQSDPQAGGTCTTKVARVLIWELSPLGPDHWESLNGVQLAKGKGPMGPLCPCAYQTFRLKGKKVIRAVFKDKQMRETPAPPPTTTTTTVVTTTTPTTTTTQPKSNVDLCLNISGEQTAVPAGYYRDSSGNCYPNQTTTTTTTTTQPKSNEDLCTNIDGEQTAVPAGYHRNSDGTCSPNSTTTTSTTTTTSSSTTDLCINIDGTQSQSDVDANYRKDPPDAGVPGNCYSK